MNPETPPLPNEAKEDLVGSAHAEVENLASPPEAPAPTAPQPAQAQARPAPPPSAGPGTPMPAMPDASAEEDDFDDEEIPDQEELEAQMLSERGGSAAKGQPIINDSAK